MKHALILTDSAAFVIAVQIRNYIIIGPELKSGIQPAITLAEYQQLRDAFVPRPIPQNDEIRDVFKSTMLESLEFILCLYFCVADYCNILHLIPKPIGRYLKYKQHQAIQKVFIAKYVREDLSKVDLSQSRDVYFSRLANLAAEIVVEDKDACIVSEFVPNLIANGGECEFKSIVTVVANRIEEFAQVHGFIHGKCHMGHISTSGQFIDFGSSFAFREPAPLAIYLKKMLPPHLRDKAVAKAQIHNVDVTAMCTLLEMLRFISSLNRPEFLSHSREIGEMKIWIIDHITAYLESDVSIFTYFRDRNEFFGGCEFGLPPMYERINEKFPIHYFATHFGLR